MLLTILMIVFGIIALSKGEFKITNNKKVKGSTGRSLGILLIIGGILSFVPDYGGGIAILILLIVIVVGLISSEKIQDQGAMPASTETKNDGQ